MDIFHDSRSLECRAPGGALKAGQSVRLRLYVRPSAAHVTLRLWNGAETSVEMDHKGLGVYEATVKAPETPCLWWYGFRVEDARGHRLYYGNARDGLGGVGAVYQDPPPSFQITVYDPDFSPPRYLADGVMYQIFPDRFHRSRLPASKRKDLYLHPNWDDLPVVSQDPRSGDHFATDFFGGDLDGIRNKLPYLKSLGITILYLNPIFKARSNHRYDTGDYHSIDPLLGDETALISLCRAAEKMGIRVMLDGVFSHTGEDSIYFNRYGQYKDLGASQSQDSPYYPWYQFSDYPDKYACWWGIHTLPEVDKNNTSFRAFIMGPDGVARRWLRAGASGWRLDVADELPLSFLQDLRFAVKAEKEDAAIMGEVWEDASNKVAYGQQRSYVLGDTVDSVMNYPLREALIRFFTHEIPASQLVRIIRSLQENYPVPFFYATMNLVGSHDRARVLNLLVKKDYSDLPLIERGKQALPKELRELAISRLEKVMQVVTAMPGMPSLYYGDEAGLEGAADPFCRGTFPWGHEDPRTLAIFREAFKLRHERPVLRRGSFDISYEGDNVLIIHREGIGGHDVFGEPLLDAPYTLRVSRDSIVL
ncbi:MAG: glycoside hydrolase family 13 protein [Eubacteriales bacterium]|jgi:4-alpha-glucanotransferase|nr:glycoside hydrolase family 13 protein [Eubacteriales bacterium]MDD3571616.1 glycoside hydrolase family 13 protein [Eubacteriales bacterium]MDD4134212.1 glycoside hydrolase family 13 protein [Eubacteriales bacterium]NLO13407.1 glycoside hydrolase family 13 protein [Clostridiales bacterium]